LRASQDQEKAMTCHICGGVLEARHTTQPFKVADDRVIIKGVPVLQCGNCSEYVIEDAVMEKVDAILSGVDSTVELETLHYLA
jgi:YgiT-type zinc finger domain-containing protein